jgi:hypothetical protein
MEASCLINVAGYWITPNGVMHRFPFQSHAKNAAKLLMIPFDESRAISFYAKAYDAGFVRVSQFKSEFAIQLSKPATKAQIDTILEMFEGYSNARIVYGSKEADIQNILELRHALMGHAPKRVPLAKKS